LTFSMPVMDGFELAGRYGIARRGQSVVLIALVGLWPAGIDIQRSRESALSIT